MFKKLLRDRVLIFLIVLSVFIKLFSLNRVWVESLYSNGFYPIISKVLRGLLGWMPFSFGDLVYIAAFLWLLTKVWKFFRLIIAKRLRQYLSWDVFRKYLKLVLVVYCVFSLFWGLNYYRQGIEAQLGMEVKPYSTEDLFELTITLQQKLNFYADKVDSLQRLKYDENSFLFKKGSEAYQNATSQYPYLQYPPASIKPSIFTLVGHWFGFTGYYNPFSAEAQLKTTIPVFLKPFVITHEIAHQLGYAKENEASFVAYLTCKASPDIYFLYSSYFETYRDAIAECMFRSKDSMETVLAMRKNIHQRVKYDLFELYQYSIKNRNIVEPIMSSAYDKYLKMNNQPKGKATYNEVIAYLIAYMKKFGKEAI